MTNRYVPVPLLIVYILSWWGAAVSVVIAFTMNTAPTAPVLKWKNAEPTSVTKVTMEFERESRDINGDVVTYEYSWTKNGEPLEERTQPVLKTEDYERDDVLEITVTPEDGTSGGMLCALPWRECAGEINSTLSVEIINSVPKVRLGDFEPEEPTHREDIVVLPRGIDVDDDEVTFTYMWYKSGEAPEEGETPEEVATTEWMTDTLPSSATKRGEEWVVRVMGNDGFEDSEPVEETITIAE